MKTSGELLAELMAAKGLNPHALSKLVGCSNQEIYRLLPGYKNQRPITKRWRERLATALDCEPEDLDPTAPAKEKREAIRLILEMTPDQVSWVLPFLRRETLPSGPPPSPIPAAEEQSPKKSPTPRIAPPIPELTDKLSSKVVPFPLGKRRR